MKKGLLFLILAFFILSGATFAVIFFSQTKDDNKVANISIVNSFAAPSLTPTPFPFQAS